MKHPACDFTLQDVHEVSDWISDSLESARPFSLIRVGDGEGLLLSMSHRSPGMDFEYLARHLGPNGLEPDIVINLKNRLIESILDADVIGVRDDIVNVDFESAHFELGQLEFLDNFRKNFRLREAEKSLGYHGARRDNSRFCSAWFHYDYHASGAVFRILSEQKRIGFISCRSRLPGMLEEMFGVSVAYYPIPDFFQDLPANHEVADYLERFEHVLRQKLVESPGMLFLVGGGLYGKLFCGLIKSQGGVALDLGSLFDAWLGIPSRPTVFRSRFNTDPDAKTVPPGLLLTPENLDKLLGNSINGDFPNGY